MWGNTWKKDHVNQGITVDVQVGYRYAPPSPGHPLGTDGGQSQAGDPPYKDVSDTARDPKLDFNAIMLNIWRVKTWKVTYSFSISGGINLFSHPELNSFSPRELWVPWDIEFVGTVMVGRQYREDYQDNPALPVDAFQVWNYNQVGPIADERHLFGTFKPQARAFAVFPNAFFGSRNYPLSDQGHYYKISGPPTAGLSVPRFGHTAFYPFGNALDLNWNTKNTKTIPAAGTGPATTGPDPRLEVIARYVAFGGDDLQMPFDFEMLDITLIRWMETKLCMPELILGQANPAHEIGPATMTINVPVLFVRSQWTNSWIGFRHN
jgi:hypothetical protein